LNQTNPSNTVAIFDLDDTLLNGSSDDAWEHFLVQKGVISESLYEQSRDYFRKRYHQGNLDVYARQHFFLRPLAEYPIAQVCEWKAHFIQNILPGLLLPKAQALIDHHGQQHHHRVIVTASNRFITEPFAKAYGVEHLIATNAEMFEGNYTGNVQGIPSFQEGKVLRLNFWLKQHHLTLEDSYFYGDSVNDLPLLEKVTHPVAVDPDEHLLKVAKVRGWKVMSLRN